MHDLRAAYAENNAQDFYASYPLGERGIETSASLLDGGEVEPGGIRDGLQ